MALPSLSSSEILLPEVAEPSSSQSTAVAGGFTNASAEQRAPSAAPSDARPPSSSSAFPSAPPTPPGGFRATVSDSDSSSDRSHLLQAVDQELDGGQPQWRTCTPTHKAAFVRPARDEPLQLGAAWYAVSAKWWRRFHRAVGDPDDAGIKQDAIEGPIDEADLGPIDNSDIVTEDGELLPGIVEGEDAVLLPSAVCEALYSWYGQPKDGHSICRFVRAIGERQELTLELYPPTFLAMRVVTAADPAITGERPARVCISAGSTIQNMCEALARAAHPQQSPFSYVPLPGDAYRVWHVPRPRTAITGAEYPASRLLEVGGALVDAADYEKTLEDALLYATGDVFAVEFRASAAAPWLVHAPAVPHAAEGDVPALEPVNVAKPHIPGTLGLGNLGNTCFMNSALQCLVHTPELTDYFLTDVYKDELNPDNPLGLHGAIAEAFGALLHRVWARSGPATSYAPREFKQALQRFAPQFSGYQQHDSQELVAFLLDGLHEDLNRILQKPCVEKPDWAGGGAREMCALARASWDGYLRRNDSVIVDLFQGQYRSTLVCPECEKVSITFDPFMYLTLPLPQTRKYKTTISFIPWGQQKAPLRVPIEISKDASFKDVRALLGRWLDIDPAYLATYETFHHRFFKDLQDGVAVSEMADSDVIACYELPCPAQQSRSFTRTAEDAFVVPVFLSEPPAARSAHAKPQLNTFGHPFLVAIPPANASDPERIRRVVTDGLARWTMAPAAMAEHTTVTAVPATDEGQPRIIEPKANMYELRLLPDYMRAPSGVRFLDWEAQQKEAGPDAPLLRDGDALFVEFEPTVRDHYFGADSAHGLSRFEPAQWDVFEHPELVELRRVAREQQRGMALQDCLDEFVREERLGEDDAWYCPACKKHQRATKKIDLWRAPDVLVVHLKRFASARDKIETFVDFPVAGLDLEPMVEERRVARALAAEGVDVAAELGIADDGAPLVYDLFAVSEHRGGLADGHYRAYALNHANGTWYDFNDSFVTETQAATAVNSNAYVLFYRRRTTRPLGGKTHAKVQAAKVRAPAGEGQPAAPAAEDTQLPTPPSERGGRALSV